MSSIKIRWIVLYAAIFAAAGCSSSNQQAGFDPVAGVHVSDFSVANKMTKAVHGNSFKQNPDRCTECHGPDLHGGISKVSCFSAGFKGMQCHENGPSNHPDGWAAADSHGAAAKDAPAASSGLAVCASCHGPNYAGGLASSCLNTAGCHTNAPHSVPWIAGTRTHTKTNAGNAPACGLCHLGNRTPPAYSPLPAGTQPGCFNNTLCHGTSTCGTCHGIPPNGGSHTVHTALAGVGEDCSVCHFEAGPGTSLHDNNTVNVSIAKTYDQSGTASFSSNTCSNISCHGGSRTQTRTQAQANPPQSTPTQTPSWLNETINVNTDAGCKSCHVLGPSQGSPENNSYYSGQHRRHVYSEGITCIKCHDTAKLADNHFTNLSTPPFEGSPSVTILNAVTYNGNTCNPSQGNLNGCHDSKNW